MLHPKAKYFLNYQYTCIEWWALEPWYDCCWWRFQCTWYEHIGLITNVASDSSAVKPHTHEIYNGSGEVSCTSFLSHINRKTRKGCLDRSIYMVKGRT